MKKTILILLSALTLFSFVSCNLDNEGILWRGQFRYPKDDKSRNFIGYNENDQKLYYTTVDGLCEFDLSNKTSNSEKILNTNHIFINNAPDIAWLSNDDKIIYIDDTVDDKNKNVQNYWVFDLKEKTLNSIKRPDFESDIDGIISTFVDNEGKQVLIASNDDFSSVQSFTVNFNAEYNTLQLNKIESDKIDGYVKSLNGLICYKAENSDNKTTLKFSYMGKQVKFTDKENNEIIFNYEKNKENDGNQIKSVAVSGDNMVVLRYTDSDTIIVYKGAAGGNAITLKQQSEIIPDDLPGIVHSFYDENNLYFLKSNSSRSSLLYKVTFDNVDDRIVSASYSTDVSGLEAEAFFKAGENIYILTKDKGVFRLDINENGGVTVSPVPDLRRR